MPARIAYFVTGHGFGHATRAALLMERAGQELPGAAFHARTSVPARIFALARAQVSRGVPDVGMIQPNPLDVDLPATLAAHGALGARWGEAVAQEAAFLKSWRADLVLSDAAALGCAAAHAAGLRAVIVSNFTWDWILDSYAAADPRWRPIVRRYADSYARAQRAWRLPMSGGFASVARVEDAPLLARRAKLSRAQARAKLGIPADGRRLALVSFGGFERGSLQAAERDWRGWRLAGFGPAPRGLRAPWTSLEDHPLRPHSEAVAAADAVLCKPGYGTFSEAAVHGARVLYVGRADYRETASLVAWLKANAAARELPREDLEAGRWGEALDALMEGPAPAPPCADGAIDLSRRLRDFL